MHDCPSPRCYVDCNTSVSCFGELADSFACMALCALHDYVAIHWLNHSILVGGHPLLHVRSPFTVLDWRYYNPLIDIAICVGGEAVPSPGPSSTGQAKGRRGRMH
jgi:hypothetical protein